FALNLVLDETTAAIEADARLTGARDVTMSASARVDAATEARMGAAITGSSTGGGTGGTGGTGGGTGGSGSGGAAVAPAIAVTSSHVKTTVRIDALTGANLLELSGDRAAVATQRTSTITKATAEATGGSTASVGVSLALTLADHAVLARTDRNVTAGGGIEFAALGSSHNEASAEASASGAKGKTDNAGETSPSSQGTVGDKLTTQRSFANTTSTANGGKGVRNSSTNPAAKSSDGEITVAAAIALTIADVSAIAELPAGLALTAGGAVALRSSQHLDANPPAEGPAVHATSAGIGAAVALSLLDLVNRAGLAADTTVTANGFTASATMTDVDGDRVHTVTSASESGAGSTDIAVAGSFALNVVTSQTQAVIPSSAIVAAGTGDVVLRAENLRADTATAHAEADRAKSGKSGGGASVASSPVLDNVTRAGLVVGAVITGGHDVTIEAIAADTVTTIVKAGSAGAQAAISPAVGI